MKKFTLLMITLLAFMAINVIGQETIYSVPGWDGSKKIHLCEGGSFVIKIDNSTSGHTYNLAQADTKALLQSIAGTGGTISFSAVSPGLGSTSYSAFDVTDFSPYVNFTSEVVADPTAPTLSKSPNVAGVCEGTDVSASKTDGSGGVSGCTDTYQYRTNGGSWQTYSPPNNISTTGVTSVEIQAFRSDAEGRGCMSSITTVSWTVYTKTTPTIGGDLAPCFNSTESYSTETGMTNYNWSVTNGTIASGSGTATISVDWDQASGPGNVSVYYTDANSCTSNTKTENVDIKALPIPSLNGNDPVCAGTTHTYSTETGMSGYTWVVTGGSGSSSANTINITWGTGSSGQVTVSYTDANGCTPATATVKNISINPLPVPTVSGPASVCANSTYTYSTQSGMTNYIWHPLVNGSGSSTADNIGVTWNNTTGTGSVTVTYTDGNTCVGTSSAYNVTINGVAQIVGGNIYCTLQEAIDASIAGQTVILLSNITEGMISINKDITLDGAGYTLNSTSATYGISVASNGVTIQNITIDNSETYGIMAYQSNNLAISTTTVKNCGTAGSGSPFASGFALNCCDNVTLTTIIATNNEGNGVSLTDCDGVTINGITTSGNSFGTFGAGVGIFSGGGYCTPAGSSNITIAGIVNISEVPAIYEQIDAGGGAITGITLPSDYDHYVGIYPATKYYFSSLPSALAAADQLLFVYPAYQSAVYVKEVSGNNLYVAKKASATVDMSLKAAILAAASGDIINVYAGTFTEVGQVAINKNLTIKGAGIGSTLINPNQNTGGSGDSRGWFLVDAGNSVNIEDMTLNGTGYDINQGIRHKGNGIIKNVALNGIKYPGYLGLGISAFGNLTIQNCQFTNIGRVGVIFFGTSCTAGQVNGMTYTGKGSGDWIDYAVEVGGGAVANITGLTATNCTGVASIDGSASAGILVTTYFGAGTTATITNSIFHDNTTGIVVGYDGSDASNVVAHNNQFYNNDFGITSTNPPVNAENNWWGAADGPYYDPGYTCGTGDEVDGPVDFVPWCTDASCTGSSSGLATAVYNTTKLTYYCTIQDAIGDANPNDVITITAGTYLEVGQIVINKNLTISGADKTTTIIKPSADQTNWFQVNAGVIFNLSKVKLDGTGLTVTRAINFQGNGLVDDCWFTQIKGASNYANGTAVQIKNPANVDITNCIFDEIGRNGIRHEGTGTASGNTYTGKGDGDWMDYFILAEYGCDITIDGNTVTNCTGEALSDGSTSSAIAVWDDPDTKAIITNNILTNNTSGIGFAGVNSEDPSYPWPQATIGNGNIITGGDYGILLGAWGTKYNPVLSFGSTTLKGQTVHAIWMDENVGIGSNYDISSVIIKDAGDVVISDNFAKEDFIHHALDGLNRGLLLWVPSNVYVTTNTLGIQRGIDVVPNSTVNIGPGTFNEDVNVNKTVVLQGAGIDQTILRGTYSGNNGGSAACLFLTAYDILVQDMTITRDYGIDLAAWYACTKNQGVSFGQTTSGNTLNRVKVVDQRNAVYINNAQNVTVTNSTIENNRTGFQMGNNISGGIISNNFIRNNFTHGLMINFDLGVVNGTNLSIEENSFYGNWYSEVYYHGTNTGDFTGADFSCNWYGISAPTINPTAAGEPGYASQVPPQFGGTSPGLLVDEIRGTKAGLITNSPWLTDGSDGSGVGFQPTGTCNGSPIEITSAVPDHIICGETTGSILISWTGGVADYTVDWGGTPVSGIANNSFDITGLAAGNYTIVVTDTYGNSDIYGPVIVQYLPVTNTTPDPDTYWPTIQAAVTAAATGDNILICDGLYKESNITVDKPLTIQGQSKTGVILAPAALNNPTDASFPTGYQYGFLIGSSDVTIKNLTIDGEANTDLGPGHNYHGGVMTDHRLGILYNNITVQDIIVQHTYRRGIQIFSNLAVNSSGHLVTGNNIQDITFGPGIVIFDGHNTISNNTIEDIPDGSGIEQVQWSGPGSVNTIIKGNIISNVYTGIQSVYASSTSMIGGLTPADGNTINLTGAKDDIGIILRDAIGGATVQNNIVTGSNEDAGIWLYREGTSGNPVLVKDNTLTTTSSSSSNSGFATGIFAVDDKAFVNGSTDNNPVYATISGNQITGFQTGVELHASGTEPVGMVSASILNNEISGSAKAVYLYDHNGATNGYSVAAVINNNDLSGNTLVVDASTISGTLVDATCNWWGTTNAATVAASVLGDVQFLPFSTSASPMNCLGVGPVVNTTNDPDRSYMTIQEAIDASTTIAGDVIEVSAGTYAEDIVLNKPLDLRGPNFNISPNGGSRFTEAIVVPATSNPDYNTGGQILYMENTASGTLIRGFIFDGDNPLLTSGVIMNGADVDVVEALSAYGGLSNVTVTNNIFQNINYCAIDFYNYYNSGSATTGNLIQYNKFDNIVPTAFGIGVLLYNNCYTDIKDNVMTRVRVGIQTGNFYQSDPGNSKTISGNSIQASRRGIFHNLAYSNASPFTLTNNNISAFAYGTNTDWDGILLSSLSVPSYATENIINGSAVSVSSQGYEIWNVKNTYPVLITGGSVSAVDIGVFANNFEGYSDNGTDGAHAVISDITITPKTGGIGIKSYDSPSYNGANPALVHLDIQDDCSITGGLTGILAEGEDASVTVTDNLATITGNEVGIRVKDGADLTSCTGNTITANTHGGIIIESTAGDIGTISGNVIFGNGYSVDAVHGLGLKYDKAALIVAENNYWGFATGPYHTAFNTCGEGNAVVGNVDFMPWCTDAGCTGTSTDLPISNISKSPVAYYCTIQDAIDDAGTGGEVILVGDGIFYENIVIDKDNLTVKNSSSPIIDGGGSGVVVTIVANGVTFDGFTVRNSGSSPLTDGGIVLAGVTGCTVKNNNVSNNNGFGIALQLSNGNSLQNNTLNNNNIAGIGLLGSSNNTIKSNNVTSTNAFSGQYGYGIILDIVEIPSPSSPTFSTGNTIGHATETPNNFSGNEGDGIYFGWGCNLNFILNNTINSNGNDGIFFWKSGSNTVTGNTITGNIAEGIQLTASPNNLITGNTITSSNKGIWIKSGWTQYQPHTAGHEALSSGNSINNNNISGNSAYGVEYVDNPGGMEGGSFVPYPYDDNIVIDAEGNWWGSNTGPTHLTNNPCGTGDAVSNNVDYDPWKNEALNTDIYQLQAFTLGASTSVCVGDPIDITLSGSQNGTNYEYTLYEDGNPVAGSMQNGTGTALSWEVTPTANVVYTVKAVNTVNLCELVMPGSTKVYVGPITTVGSIADACVGSEVEIPVTATSFAEVGTFNLKLNYTPSVLSYSDFTYNTNLPDMFITNPTPGVLNIGWSTTGNPVTLIGEQVILTLKFNYLGGTSPLTWNNTFDTYCEYGSGAPDYVIFCDDPTEDYYFDGSVSGFPRPTVFVSGDNTLCYEQSTDITFDFTGTAPWNLTYTVNGNPVVVEGITDDPYVVSVTPLVSTTYVATALSDAYCVAWPEDMTGSAVVTVNALPVVSSVDLVSSTDGSTWTGVTGNLSGGYDLCIDTDYEYYYLDIDALSSTPGLLSPSLEENAFTLKGTYPASFFDYWSDKGVYEGCTGPWQPFMWDIINGDAPMFYISWDGADYKLIDGLQYQASGGTVAATLRITADYPQDIYTFNGSVTDVNGCISSFFDVFIEINTTPHMNPVADQFHCAGVTVPETGLSATTLSDFVWSNDNEDIGLGAGGNGNVPEFEALNNTNGPITATITVTPTATPSGCVGATVELYTITVYPSPVVTEVMDAEYCNGDAGDAITFSSPTTGGTITYTWTSSVDVGFGTGPTTGNIGTYTAANGGNAPLVATVSVTATVNGCTGPATEFTVTVNPTPVVSSVDLLSSTDGSTWTGVTGNLSGGYDLCIDTDYEYYYLDIDALSSTPGLLSPSLGENAFTLKGIYPASFFDYWSDKGVYEGCTGPWQPFMWDIINGDAPMFYISWDGADYKLIDGLQYQASGGTVAATLRITADYPQDIYTFNGSVTDVNGCISSFFDVFIEINTTPHMNPVADQFHCAGVTVPETGLSATTLSDFVWSNDNEDIGLGAGGNGNVPEFEALNNTNGPITATITVTPTATPSGCVGATVELYTITVYPSPVVTEVMDAEYCNGDAGDAITFSSPTTGGTITYTWTSSVDVGFGTGPTTGNIGTYTAANGGNAPLVATVSVTATVNGCTGPATEFTVTVNPTPVVSSVDLLSSTDGSTWTGVTGNLSGGYDLCIDTDYEYYYLDIDALSSTPGLLSPSLGENAFTLKGIYPASFFDYWSDKGVYEGCTGPWQPFMWDIINGDAPMFYISWDGADYKLIDGLQYQASGGTVAATLRITADYPQDIYTFNGSVTDVNGCISSFFDVFIEINTTPHMNPVADQFHCAGVTVPETGLSATTLSDFVWSNDNEDIGLGAGGNGNVPEFEALNNTNGPITATITVTPTATPSGCVGATVELYTITVYPSPVVTEVMDAEYCNGDAGDAITFSSPTTGGTITYTWTSSVDVGFGTGPTTGNIGTYTAANGGNAPLVATVSVTATVNGCTGPATEFTVTVNPTPVVSYLSNAIYCNGDAGAAITFSSPTTGGTITYNWTSSVGVGFGTGGTGNIDAYTATNTGNIPLVANISVTATVNGCTGPATTFTVTVNPTPTATASVTTLIPCNGTSGTVTIVAAEVTATPITYYFGALSNGTGIFEGITAGTYDWYITDGNGCSSTTGSLEVTQPDPITVSGYLNYYNTGNTAMDNVTISLEGTDHTTTTSSTGAYSFINVCPGTYNVIIETLKPTDGSVNITDAAQVAYWSVPGNAYEIQKVRFYAGDVGTPLNRLNSADAGAIQDYFLWDYTSWALREKWTFWNVNQAFSSNPALPDPNVVQISSIDVVSGNTSQNFSFYGMATGDFNRSFVPGIGKSGSESLSLIYGETITVNANTDVDLPVKAITEMEVGAISLILNFPADEVQINGIYLGNDPNSPVAYSVSGNELRIGWYSLSPIMLGTGETLITLQLTTGSNFGEDDAIMFSLAADPLNELADGNYQVINEAILSVDIIKSTGIGVGELTIPDNLTLENHPNPFNGKTTFNYSLPYDGKVTLIINNLIGERVSVLVDEIQSAGNYKYTFEEGNLESGVYTATLILQNDSNVAKQIIKIVNK